MTSWVKCQMCEFLGLRWFQFSAIICKYLRQTWGLACKQCISTETMPYVISLTLTSFFFFFLIVQWECTHLTHTSDLTEDDCNDIWGSQAKLSWTFQLSGFPCGGKVNLQKFFASNSTWANFEPQICTILTMLGFEGTESQSQKWKKLILILLQPISSVASFTFI